MGLREVGGKAAHFNCADVLTTPRRVSRLWREIKSNLFFAAACTMRPRTYTASSLRPGASDLGAPRRRPDLVLRGAPFGVPLMDMLARNGASRSGRQSRPLQLRRRPDNASQSFAPLTRNKFKLFSAAACTSPKIPLAERASKRRRREEQSAAPAAGRALLCPAASRRIGKGADKVCPRDSPRTILCACGCLCAPSSSRRSPCTASSSGTPPRGSRRRSCRRLYSGGCSRASLSPSSSS